MSIFNDPFYLKLQKLVYGQTKVLKSGVKNVCRIQFKGGPETDPIFSELGDNGEMVLRLKFDCDRLKQLEPFLKVKRGGKVVPMRPDGKRVGIHVGIKPVVREVDEEAIEEERLREELEEAAEEIEMQTGRKFTPEQLVERVEKFKKAVDRFGYCTEEGEVQGFCEEGEKVEGYRTVEKDKESRLEDARKRAEELGISRGAFEEGKKIIRRQVQKMEGEE